MSDTCRVAVVQAEPAWLDIEAGVEKTISLIDEAADAGAALVAFPETWLPGYPIFLWLGPVVWQMPFVARYHANSISVDSHHLTTIRKAARRRGIIVVLGYSEKVHGSLYMAQTIIGTDGEVLLHRRKLKPTHVERSLFGEGDGSGLKVIDTELGRLGALNCWEHLQPLNRYAMFAQHEQIHVAAWPAFGLYKDIAPAIGSEANMAVSQTYALEGGCFVLAATQVISEAGIEVFAGTDEQRALITAGSGCSRVYAPDSTLLSKPLDEHAEGLVLADLDLALIDLAKNAADPAGHYARPDVTRLLLDTRPSSPVISPEFANEPLFPDLDEITDETTVDG
ncbi:carbon-nitrogen hydrolase family protein [Lentzea sp. HUAS TT2]|uniref:carbon-nitrogen hydrolase family protein n=1 Tax=Lentzea sp. HUAS TT2 TaxID=3447454 RepID=UPI003F70787D